MAIRRGERVRTRDFWAEWSEQVALTGIEMGHDFKVVWVCSPAEWDEAHATGREPEGVPWPAEDVTEVERATA